LNNKNTTTNTNFNSKYYQHIIDNLFSKIVKDIITIRVYLPKNVNSYFSNKKFIQKVKIRR